jgi:hypothetical protein
LVFSDVAWSAELQPLAHGSKAGRTTIAKITINVSFIAKIAFRPEFTTELKLR